MTDANNKKTLSLNRPTSSGSKMIVKKNRSVTNHQSSAHGGSSVLDSEKAKKLELVKNNQKVQEQREKVVEEQRRKDEAERARREAERKAKEEKERSQQKAEQPVAKEQVKQPVEQANKKPVQNQNNNNQAKKPNQQNNQNRNNNNNNNSRPQVHQSVAISTPDELEAAEMRRAKSFKHNKTSGGAGGLSGSNRDEERRPSKYNEDKWSSGKKFNMNSYMRGGDDDDEGGRGRSMASIKRAREKERNKLASQQKPVEKVYREVIIPETITVQELASRMAERGADVVKQLMKLGVMATITQTIDADTAEIVVTEMGHKVRRVADSDVEEGLRDAPDNEDDKLPRPPVITVMGHVDHGKTSLLDALRETNVVAREAGGITQHIGAYQVTLEDGHKVTFIDTPGHAAFTEMRARGAKITDIVILVVAANDGIMPQTREAISHAKAAGVPIIVAINKIDVPGANPEKVRQDLMQEGVFVETMGGDVLSVEVSAKKRINLDKLMEAVLLQAEMLDLKANPNHTAEGAIVEAKMEKGRGSVATILVQRGTLKQGDIFVAGKDWGRVKALLDENGKRVEEAGPAFPVEVVGFQSTASAGDDFVVVNDEDKAREIAAYRQRKEREALQVKSARSAIERFRDGVNAGTVKELPIVIKADVQGSVEAIVATLEKFNKAENKKVGVKIVHSAVGAINESDVTLAKASNALIVGFNVRANTLARNAAKQAGIDMHYYSIIYELTDAIHNLLEGMLPAELKEKRLGIAKIREVFNISKVGKVAGCMVKEGLMKHGAKIRLLRSNVVYHTGAIDKLKRFKDDVKEVREGYECGISFVNYNDFQADDTIECYEIEEVAAKLDIIEV
ncbi:MAG: translation initiation factor IF-2 [Alphaproteobacteria bacterium]|nr:translation initiation factor IF-2 [Alphaproteobacteria bacterium]